MLSLGILVSGGGTNLQAIIDKIECGYLANCEIVTVVSSRENAYALQRAAKHGIPSICILRKNFVDSEDYDRAMLEHFKSHNVDLVVLAGFLSMLGPSFVEAYRNRIINIHPSLIPSFCGKGFYGLAPHKAVLDHGVKITGATVHFVDYEYDSGPIILQKAVEVLDDDTPETLQLRVMREAEWELLPEAIKLYSEGRLMVEGRKVRIRQQSSDMEWPGETFAEFVRRRSIERRESLREAPLKRQYRRTVIERTGTDKSGMDMQHMSAVAGRQKAVWTAYGKRMARSGRRRRDVQQMIAATGRQKAAWSYVRQMKWNG